MLALSPFRLSIWLSRRWRVMRCSNFSKPSRHLMLFWAWKEGYFLCWQTEKRKTGNIVFKKTNTTWFWFFFFTRNKCRKWGRSRSSIVSKPFLRNSKVTRLVKLTLCWSLIIWIELPVRNTVSIRTRPWRAIKNVSPTRPFTQYNHLNDKPTCKD